MAKQAKTTSRPKAAAPKRSSKLSSPAQPGNGEQHEGEEGAQDAVTLLKSDHRKVEELFRQFESASDNEQKEQLAHQICHELMTHTLLEEEIFYPECRENDLEDDVLDEAQVEHDSAKVLIVELLTLSPDSDYYDAKVKVLSEMIKHHVAEEEKADGIFAKAQKADMDMKEIGRKLQQRKQDLKQKVESGQMGLPQPRALFSLMEQPSYQENRGMPRMGGRERDDYGRFMSEDDDRRGGGNGGRGRSSSQYRERDDNGRFMSDDDRRGGSGRSGSQYRERDENGRFVSDDEQGYSSRSSRGRYEDDDGDRRGGYRGQSGQNFRERDEQGRFMSDDEQGGYSSRGSRGRYEDEDDRRYSSRGSQSGGRYEEEDDDRSSSRSGGGRGQGHGGWFGDSEGHSQAAQRGWDERGSSRSTRSRDDDDDRRYSSRSTRSRMDDDDDRRSSSRSGGGSSQGHGGWFGDARGHSQAAKRGWQHRD